MHEKEGFPAVTLRPPFVYGPENPFYREQFFWDRMRDGRRIVVPGDGSRAMHFVYVNDLVEACLLAAAEKDAVGEAFNVGHREPVSQLELVRCLAVAAGSEPRAVLVPRGVIEASGGELLGETLYFGEYFDLPSITENVSKAERLLGLQPAEIREGLEATYAWYITHGERREIDYAFEDKLLARAQNGSGGGRKLHTT
jgi:nucleoside-diphosphate-sugar epimerase